MRSCSQIAPSYTRTRRTAAEAAFHKASNHIDIKGINLRVMWGRARGAGMTGVPETAAVAVSAPLVPGLPGAVPLPPQFQAVRSRAAAAVSRAAERASRRAAWLRGRTGAVCAAAAGPDARVLPLDGPAPHGRRQRAQAAVAVPCISCRRQPNAQKPRQPYFLTATVIFRGSGALSSSRRGDGLDFSAAGLIA